MKKENAFTLIELLAVIVILAVIALIATPLVMNTIEDAKDGALKSTVRNIIDIAETEYQKKLIDDSNRASSIDFSTLSYKGEKVDVINGSFNEDGTVNIAIYKENKCVYKRGMDTDVTLDKSLSENTCLIYGEEILGNSLISALISQPGTSSDTTEGFLDKKNGVYTYTGASGTVGTNYLWYAGHLWRIMKIEGNRITLITSYPVTSIQWGSSVANQPSLERSYVGEWLTNVFLKSLPVKVQSKLENMKYNRNIYDGSNVVLEEISNVKVRLLTEAEYNNFSGVGHYLDVKDYSWLADITSPTEIRYLHSNGYLSNSATTTIRGIRPVIEVSNLAFIQGDGTYSNPYIAGEKDVKTTDELKVGEYVSVPKSDGTTYLARVVKHDESGTKVILNGLYTTSVFGDQSILSSTSTVYTRALTNFRNTLDPTYFDSTNKAFEITMYKEGSNYKSDNPVYVNDINIGLPSIGEMFSGNDIDLSISSIKTFVDAQRIENNDVSNNYWLANAYSLSFVYSVTSDGYMNSVAPSTIYGIRPTWYLSSTNITGGTGTASDPYRLKD